MSLVVAETNFLKPDEYPRIIIEAKIYGMDEKKYIYIPMMIDTGSLYTIISIDIIESIGYDIENQSLRDVDTFSLSGKTTSKLIEINKLEAIWTEFNNMEVLAKSIPNEIPVVGILGLNFLSKFDIHISFSRKVIRVDKMPYINDMLG